jgi:hypothetical protein
MLQNLINKSVILAAFLILLVAEYVNIESELYTIELPLGYKPIEIKTPYVEPPEWKIKNRTLIKKYWR